jgi:hypothetical protein
LLLGLVKSLAKRSTTLLKSVCQILSRDSCTRDGPFRDAVGLGTSPIARSTSAHQNRCESKTHPFDTITISLGQTRANPSCAQPLLAQQRPFDEISESLLSQRLRLVLIAEPARPLILYDSLHTRSLLPPSVITRPAPSQTKTMKATHGFDTVTLPPSENTA